MKKFDIWGKTLVRTFLVLLFLSCTSSAIAALADLQGGAPEEASVTVTVNKPANAVNGLLTLVAYDADFTNEGELVINGNTAIPLFGAAGVRTNDRNSANITISTPAAHWKDGNNTLLFRHISTQGYVIDDVTVVFELDTNASPETNPKVSTGSSLTGGLFPVDMTGPVPEEASVNVTVNKPANAVNGLLTLVAYDADFTNEGELVINGNTAIPLFGAAGVRTNDRNSANITISTPAAHWKDGNNTLLFRHISTQGYAIYDATVLFEAWLDNGGETTTTPDGNPDAGDRGTSTSPTGTSSINLNWVAPATRADGAALAMSEIAGYTVHYGTSKGNYPYSIAINDSSATSVTVTNLQAGTYYMVMTTSDMDDRVSSYSSMATKQTQ